MSKTQSILLSEHDGVYPVLPFSFSLLLLVFYLESSSFLFLSG